ncbi:PqiC family protein (plasmid) [Cupriavidus basilensis]
MRSIWILRQATAGLLVIASAFGAAGCTSPEPRYFTLAGTVQNDEAGRYRGGDRPPVRIELQPVRVPDRLNRTSVVLRDGDAMRVLETARWSASFPAEFRDALALQLQQRLQSVDRYKSGSAPVPLLYRISVDVVQADAALDDRVDAVINWTIKSVPDGKMSSGQARSVLPAPGGINGIVGAYQQVVRKTANDIDAALLAMAAFGG